MKKVNHLAIILDGNRRLAKKLMLKPWEGHKLGARKVEELFTWCRELGIKELTLYALSYDNFHKRPKDELDYLLNLFKQEFTRLLDDSEIMDNKVKIRFIGNRLILPKDIQEIMHDLEEKTRFNEGYTINFAIAYGGREEIIEAVKAVADEAMRGNVKPEEISMDYFSEKLYLQSNPDLIIRTGGNFRTSNFLVWQSAYSEWHIIKKFWPEFTKQDLINAIEDYSKREIRLGK